MTLQYIHSVTNCMDYFVHLVGIYGEPKGNLLTLAEEHQGGVTHLVFSPDGHKLYSGGRKVTCY